MKSDHGVRKRRRNAVYATWPPFNHVVASMNSIPEVKTAGGAATGWAELALAVGGFGIGTGEFAIMDCCRTSPGTSVFRYPERGM
jgi:hypothetical protein